MTTQFPTEIDDFYNPDPNAPLSSGHAAQHADDKRHCEDSHLDEQQRRQSYG